MHLFYHTSLTKIVTRESPMLVSLMLLLDLMSFECFELVLIWIIFFLQELMRLWNESIINLTGDTWFAIVKIERLYNNVGKQSPPFRWWQTLHVFWKLKQHMKWIKTPYEYVKTYALQNIYFSSIIKIICLAY